MFYQKYLNKSFFLLLLFIIKINCSVIQHILDFNISKYIEINDINNINCQGNYYITCINGCALENQDRIRICEINNHNRCIRKKGSSRDIEITSDPNQYNRFSFDYTGNDKFKLFSDNSRDYIALHLTGDFQWRTGNFEVEVWDTNDGVLDIFGTGCEDAGGIPYCKDRSMCPYFDTVTDRWGHDRCWVAIKY